MILLAYVKLEWRDDLVGLCTVLRLVDSGKLKKPAKTLFGYEGELGERFKQIDELERVGDITMCESISLQDKMMMMENW